MTLVLASRSQARRALLKGAGIEVALDAADLDEGALSARLLSEGGDARSVAQALAGEKAMAVSARRPGDWVIGSDQTLEHEGTLYGKAASLDEARARLTLWSGTGHRLHSGVALARDGRLVWTACETATLVMRPLSADFIDGYLARNAEAATASVGGYWLEAEGTQLFERIEGDYFTILGLPLLPLMGALRDQGLLAS